MGQLASFWVKYFNIQDHPEYTVIGSLIIFVGFFLANTAKDIFLFKRMGLHEKVTNERLENQKQRIDAVEKRNTEETNRLFNALEGFGREFKEGMSKINSMAEHLKELVLFNKNVKDDHTYETRIRIKEAGLNSWAMCKRKLKEWARNTVTKELLAEKSEIEIHGLFTSTALSIYKSDDDRTKSNTINPVQNELLNNIDFKVLPGLQTETLPFVKRIKDKGEYTQDDEDEMINIIERHQHLWERLFDKEYMA